MTKEQIFNTIKMLANSQGCYGRLLRNLQDAEAEYGVEFVEREFYDKFKHCKDQLDFIMEFEG